MFGIIRNQMAKAKEKRIQGIAGNEALSKSQRIKDLHNQGLTVSEIAHIMGVSYNFAYNVTSNYVARDTVKVEPVKVETKKEKIVELFTQGKTNKEIAVLLKTNYNYVYKVTKELKDSYAEVAATK